YIIERLMKQIPNSTYVKSLYSRLLIEKGQYKSALDMVNEGLKNNPYDAKLHYLMLDLLIKEAEYKKAMITLEGSSNHISKQAYINYKSKIYLKMGNEEKAINYSDKSIEEYPEDAYIRISRAELMYELYNNYKDKDYNKAHKFQEKAIENLNLAKEYTNNIDYIKKINELKEKLE
ncbi:MAG: tetratricopeptide repeat protein, partial [Spirochaetota bacterium]